jgi:allantoate deiminase
MPSSADDLITLCRRIAQCSESATGTTRTFLSAPMHQVHELLSGWMRSLDMHVSVDAMGNLRGLYSCSEERNKRRLLIGSHLDTVANAGAFDGVLGVVLGVALMERLDRKLLPFDIEVIGFSEEEGMRFNVPFLGSRALVGRIDDALLQVTDAHGDSVQSAIHHFGLDPADIGKALLDPRAFAYVEFHIEQGPSLEHAGEPLGVVEAIAGQSRYAVRFTGRAGHAGTTPMHLRADALAGAAEWIAAVEAEAKRIPGLMATVGMIHSEPPAGNVIPALVTASVDIRHAADATRTAVVSKIFERADEIAARRKLEFSAEIRLDQPAVPMDAALLAVARRAAVKAGCNPPVMASGAGHDAMILAEKIPSVMFFLRTPGGISHHPAESVLAADVEMALSAGLNFITALAAG